MAEQHTAEPWAKIPEPNGNFTVLCAGDIEISIAHDCPEEDACRIVAAVNACKGIPTDALEKGGVGWIHGSLVDLTVENALHKAGTPPL